MVTFSTSVWIARVHGTIPVSKIVGVEPLSLNHLVELVSMSLGRILTACQNLGDLCFKQAGYA